MKITSIILTFCISAAALRAFGAVYTESGINENYEFNEQFAKELSALIAKDKAVPFSADYASEESEFASGRIVAFSDTDFDTRGAVKTITDNDGMYVLQYESAEDAEAAYTYYLSDDGVTAVPDITITVDADTAETFSEESNISWGADFIGADQFNDALLKKYGSTSRMPSVTVAVIDSGVDYNHPFLSGRVDTSRGYDYFNGDHDPMDDNSHGTHVAGIIADCTLENVTIIPIKAMDSSGNGTTSTIMASVRYARKIGVDVINMSCVGKDLNQYIQQVNLPEFELLADADIVTAVAAGNFSANVQYYFPANIEHNITVSACNKIGIFDSSYSNYGDLIDICAPGTSIKSTVPNNGYRYKSGTSMACPHVAAAAAMLKTMYNSFGYHDIIDALSSAAAAPDSPKTEYYGSGLLDLIPLIPINSTATEQPTADPDQLPVDSIGKSPVTSALYNSENGRITIYYDRELIPAEGAVTAVCTYSGGVLKNAVYMPVSASDSQMGFYVGAADFDTMKIFVWKSLESMVPVGSSYMPIQ